MVSLRNLHFLLVLLATFYILLATGSAQEFTSTDFKILNPVILPGGYSTSASYRLNGVISQISTGISTSGSFEVKSGFLYYPGPAVAAAGPAAAVATVSGNVGGGGPILAIYKKLFVSKLFKACTGPDLDCDGRVGLEDVSVMLYWWEKPLKKPNFASLFASILGLGRPSPDLNSDATINLFDLSILMHNWTD